jgi:hypothetical protein
VIGRGYRRAHACSVPKGITYVKFPRLMTTTLFTSLLCLPRRKSRERALISHKGSRSEIFMRWLFLGQEMRKICFIECRCSLSSEVFVVIFTVAYPCLSHNVRDDLISPSGSGNDSVTGVGQNTDNWSATKTHSDARDDKNRSEVGKCIISASVQQHILQHIAASQ